MEMHCHEMDAQLCCVKDLGGEATDCQHLLSSDVINEHL